MSTQLDEAVVHLREMILRGKLAPGERVIDIGCGDRKYPGSVGIDIAPLRGVDIRADIGRGLPLRDSSVDAVHARAVERGLEIAYSLRDEEWGVRRFMLREPSGTIVNVVSHRSG